MSREAQAMVEARRVDLALLPTAFELTRLLVTPSSSRRVSASLDGRREPAQDWCAAATP